MGHVSEAFTRLALAHPERHFSLRHNQRTIYDLPPVATSSERISCFFGQDLAAGLIAVESRDDAVGLRGYVAHPSHSRSHPRMQYLFLNGRHIRDRALQHALGEAYRGLLLTGRYPICFLWLSLPPEMVDVNVHPTKMEVRFQDGGRIYSQLLGTLRTRFLTTDLSTRIQPVAESEAAQAHDPARTAQLRQELTDWAKGQMAQAQMTQAQMTPWTEPAAAGHGDVPLRQTGLALAEPPPRSPLVLNELDESWLTRPPAARVPLAAPTALATELPLTSLSTPSLSTTGLSAPEQPDIASQQANGASSAMRAAADAALRPPVSALQVHNRYLIAETDDGLEVIDQHALHERILYELLREKVLGGALESQHLLVPEPVDLCADEVAAVLAERELLGRLGMTVEAFGGETVIVRSYPAMLANFKPVEILRGLVERLLAGGKKPDRRDLLDELLHMISCKAAIKAGDRLSIDEIDSLLRQRHLVRDTHHCPHGRPTALVFTREELDRQFKRT
jgi:DNA mismatch repair protein MutL